MLFVTFHGGKSTSSVPCPVNNVYAYDETSKSPTDPYLNVLNVPASVDLSELRALCFANGYLYVANGSKKTNSVLCFQQSSQTKNPCFIYLSTFVSGSVNSLNHPFGICFDTANHAYVSSQDTNVVTQLGVTGGGTSTTVVQNNAASYLTQFGTGYLNGTFVASHKPVPNYPGTPDVKDKVGGLDFAPSSGSISHSVRDLVIVQGLLCVADEAGQMVKVYDLTSGTFLCAASLSAGPIHMLAVGATLYVAAGSAIYTGAPTETNAAWTLTLTALALSPALPDEASGFCFDGSGNLYVALRTQNSIYQYNSSLKGAAFLTNLPDNPEFVVWQATIAGI
jgi:hypothetical protein